MAADRKKIAIDSSIAAAVIAGVAAIVAAFISRSGPSSSKPTLGTVTLQSSASGFDVRCPMTFGFTGIIQTIGGSGTISYRFDRSDGFDQPTVAGQIQTINVNGASTSRVTDEWTPNIPVGDVSRTETLVVVAPTTVSSQPVSITGRCDATLPPNPPVPPPNLSPPG